MEEQFALKDPVKTAWLLNGQPVYPYASFKGICGRCEEESLLYPVDKVVSRNFTDWETVNPNAKGLCAACVFSFTQENIKILPYLVSGSKARFIMKKDLIELLSNPLDSKVALTMPLSGKKHLLPKAKFGKIVSDEGLYFWNINEVKLFKTMLYMRELGCLESELSLKAPPYNLLKNNIEKSETILNKWTILVKWNNSPQFKIAIKASREPKEVMVL